MHNYPPDQLSRLRLPGLEPRKAGEFTICWVGALFAVSAGGAVSCPRRTAFWPRLRLQMDPAHADQHLRLWIDVVRRARPGYVAAPAALLALLGTGHGAMRYLPPIYPLTL